MAIWLAPGQLNPGLDLHPVAAPQFRAPAGEQLKTRRIVPSGTAAYGLAFVVSG